MPGSRSETAHQLVRAGRFFWRYLLPPLVIACVVWYFFNRLRQPVLWNGALVFRIEWIVPAGLVYLIAYTIWGRYYVTLLRNQGATVSSATGLRAYFISQMGKYVPGKVLVIIMRIAMLGKIGISKTAVGITALYESVVWAGSGALVGVLLLPETLWNGMFSKLQEQGQEPPDVNRFWLILPLGAASIGLVGLNRFVNRINRWRRGPNAAQLPRVKLHWVLLGLAWDSFGWLVMGLSLFLMLNGLHANTFPFTLDTCRDMISIAAIAYIFGFVAFFMPAGLGVRDIALQLLLAVELKTQMGPGNADAANALAAILAIIFRVIGTAVELITAGLLYRFAPSDARAALRHDVALVGAVSGSGND
jgi:glycosyltransferase 2 family protein